jgi:hypothetical protein
VVKKIMLFAIILCCAASSGFCSQEEPIGGLFRDKKVINVYIDQVSNASGESLITIEDFKAIIEASLLKRKSMTFRLVGAADQSDIQISSKIEKFQYLVRGPLKPTIGLQTTLLDAAATATMNYVEMLATFTVIDTKSGNILWSDGVGGYLKKVMTPEESVPMISDKVSREFIWRCFGKANFRSRKGV